MEAMEHGRCDSEVISMVNHNHFCYPTREHNRLLQETQNMAVILKANRKAPKEPEVTREKLMMQLAHGLAPICIGMAWVLGAFEGLADPAFTSIITGVCILWGCVNWKWGKFNG